MLKTELKKINDELGFNAKSAREFGRREWTLILSKFPQFDKYCKCWDSFYILDWKKLIISDPKFLERCDRLESFTQKDWVDIIIAQKKLALKCKDLKNFTTSSWIRLLDSDFKFFYRIARLFNGANRAIVKLAPMEYVRNKNLSCFDKVELANFLRENPDYIPRAFGLSTYNPHENLLMLDDKKLRELDNMSEFSRFAESAENGKYKFLLQDLHAVFRAKYRGNETCWTLFFNDGATYKNAVIRYNDYFIKETFLVEHTKEFNEIECHIWAKDDGSNRTGFFAGKISFNCFYDISEF